MNRPNQLFAVLLLLIATVSWGAMFPVAKPALAVIDPYYLTLIRYAPAGLVFLLILALVEGRRALSLEGRLPLLFGLATLGFAGFNLLAFTGLAHSRPEHAAVIMATMPMPTHDSCLRYRRARLSLRSYVALYNTATLKPVMARAKSKVPQSKLATS